MTVDDKFSAILFSLELLGLYYNEDMVETAGVKPPGTLIEPITVNSVLTKDMIADLLVVPKGLLCRTFLVSPFLGKAAGTRGHRQQAMAQHTTNTKRKGIHCVRWIPFVYSIMGY